ncbi:unnamed protein product [Effrenium voratum]|nr:unnamed protein product [Effrenium voratum]
MAVMDYVRSKQLFRGEHICNLDQALQQLFSPVIPPGATYCQTSELMTLTSRLLTKYVETRGYS